MSKSTMKILTSNCDFTLRCSVSLLYFDFFFVCRKVTDIKEERNHCDIYEDKKSLKYKIVTVQVPN